MKYLYIILIAVLSISCVNSVEKKITITDFSHPFLDSLYPNSRMKDKYITYNVEIRGYTNDTIIVYFSKSKKYFKENKIKPTYLSGKINERYWEEHLGKTQKHLRIDPYKATKGELKIKYGLYK